MKSKIQLTLSNQMNKHLESYMIRIIAEYCADRYTDQSHVTANLTASILIVLLQRAMNDNTRDYRDSYQRFNNQPKMDIKLYFQKKF